MRVKMKIDWGEVEVWKEVGEEMGKVERGGEEGGGKVDGVEGEGDGVKGKVEGIGGEMEGGVGEGKEKGEGVGGVMGLGWGMGMKWEGVEEKGMKVGVIEEVVGIKGKEKWEG